MKHYQIPVSAECRKAISDIFLFQQKHLAVFKRLISHYVTYEKFVNRLELFIMSPVFQEIINNLWNATSRRFEETLDVLLYRMYHGDEPIRLGEVYLHINFDCLKKVLLPFLRRTTTFYDFYREFINACIEIGMKNGLADQQDFLFLFNSSEFKKVWYVYNLIDYNNIEYIILMKTIVNLVTTILVKTNDFSRARLVIKAFANEYLADLYEMSRTVGKADVFVSSLIFALFKHHNPSQIINNLELFSKHFNSISKSNVHKKKNIKNKSHNDVSLQANEFIALAQIWHVLWEATEDDSESLVKFIKSYYKDKNDTLFRKIWDFTLSHEPGMAIQCMKILTSNKFMAVFKRYQKQDENEILWMLIYNIAFVLSKKFDIEKKNNIIQKILNCKLDTTVMRNRAMFFLWLKSQCYATLFEERINVYYLYDYCHADENSAAPASCGRSAVRGYVDEGHRLLCTMIDQLPDLIDIPNETIFISFINRLADFIWLPLEKLFPQYRDQLNEIRCLVNNREFEYKVIDAIQSLQPEEFLSYYRQIKKVIFQSKQHIMELVGPDEWKAVIYEDAAPYCQEVLTNIIGTISLQKSDDNIASTNGKVISLPAYMRYFNDPIEPLLNNRDLTAYIGLSLHEAGHIIAGSFVFNLDDYIKTLNKPEIYKDIWNAFEDFRVEAFITKTNLYPQAEEILEILNRYLHKDLATKEIPSWARLLMWILDLARGYFDELMEMPGYQEQIEQLRDKNLYTGEFYDIEALAHYGAERLRAMEVFNPLASFILADEFYNILQKWPESELQWNNNSQRVMGFGEDHNTCSDPNQTRPLTKEELEELYRRCNENPEQFLKSHSLPVYPSLIHSPGSDTENSHEREGKHEKNNIAVMKHVKPDYENKGTIDRSTRTQLDDEYAKRQIKLLPNFDEEQAEIVKYKDYDDSMVSEDSSVKSLNEPSKFKKRYIRGYVKNKGYTNLSMIKEFSLKGIDHKYMATFKMFERIAYRVYEELARLLPAINESYQPSSEEGELDIDILVNVLSDRNQKIKNAEIFEKPEQDTRRSIDVIIGLDASGSTCSQIQSNRIKNMGLTILDVEKAFAIILGRALKYITPSVFVYGFNSGTSTNIYRAETIEAISLLRSEASNRDGDFIRYITNIFTDRDAELRIFFLLSDGQPSAFNYYGSEALDDTCMAMQESINAGIKLVYYNCDSTESDYFYLFKRVSTYARHFTDPCQMLPTIPEMVRNILKASL